MPNYPITDPAEIAKLPDGVYVTQRGSHLVKGPTGWEWLNPSSATDGTPHSAEHMIVYHSGGIAARLVPEMSDEA